ncbi:MAG TPA: hypothetical protein VMB21_18325 [Candidatus Limnocylindria bacterium]|nr:hypothetical protein [Candidatus Limnocylindria bacterium]
MSLTAAAANAVAKTTAAVPTALRDIKGPIEIPTVLMWLIRIGFVLVLAGLLWLGWWLWQKRRPKEETAAIVPPDQRARERLAQALALIDEPERFCTTVSEITRTYLEERFGLRAPDQTTEEFLAELPRSIVLDVRHKEFLADFLTRCDLVKFARFEPTRPELEQLHASALNLVEETVPRMAPAVLIPPPQPPPIPPPMPPASSPPPAPPPFSAAQP